MPSPLPETMKAAVIDKAGPPEAIQIRDVPVPRITHNHVIIALDYASAGSWDAQMRSGAWGAVKQGTILGADGSGRVAAVSADVTRLKVGDRVYSYSYENAHGGFYAEYVSVPADRVEVVPEQVDQKVAGAMPCVGMTALSGLQALKVPKGWTLLVYGASGGVGSFCVWLGNHAFGATVVGTARHDAEEYVRQLGAAHAVDSKSTTLRNVPELDGALLTADGETAPQFLAHLKQGAPFAYPNGVEPVPKYEGHRGIGFDGAMTHEHFESFNKAIGSQTIPLRVAEFPLEHVAEAHRRLDQGHVVGKIVLKIR